MAMGLDHERSGIGRPGRRRALAAARLAPAGKCDRIFRLRRAARVRLLPAVCARTGALPAVHSPAGSFRGDRHRVPRRGRPPSPACRGQDLRRPRVRGRGRGRGDRRPPDWLQHTPEAERPSCGPGLDYLLSRFGALGGLQRILRGSGECGVVDWTFLGLSIAEWSLACFVGLAIYALVLATRD